MQKRYLTFILRLLFLFCCTAFISAAANPAENITIQYPSIISLSFNEEALVNLEFKIPLGYFIFVKNTGASSNKVIEFSLPGNSGLQIKRVNMPDGQQFRNDRILSNSGTFQLFITNTRSLKPGSTINVPLNINLQVGTAKTTFAAYTLQKNLTFKISGTIGSMKTDPPPSKPTAPPVVIATIRPEPDHIPDEIRWIHNYKDGLTAAQQRDKNMLLFFTSLGKCDVCRWMENNTFTNSEVINLVARGFIAVKIPDKINGRTNPDTSHFKINAYPTVIIANSKGVALYNKWARITPAELIQGIRAFAKMDGPQHIGDMKPDIPDTPVKPEMNENIIERYHREIAGVLNLKGDLLVFFLKNGTYIDYKFRSGRISPGYPRNINNREWRGLEPYKMKIQTALNWGNDIAHIFLTDGTYLRLDLKTRSVDPGYPKPINNSTWPGLLPYRDKIQGAVEGKHNKIFFFLSTGEYIQYDMKRNAADRGFPRPVDNRNWPGLESYARNIIAVASMDNSAAYFYLNNGRVLKFNFEKNMIEPDNRDNIP